MTISSRDFSNPFICKLLFFDTGEAIPVGNADLLQNFFDTSISGGNYIEVYNSLGKVKFSEAGEETSAGILYKQQLQFQMPSGDLKRADRVNEVIKNLKFVAIGLTNGHYILLGRNDWFQNTRPKIKIETNQKTAGFKISTTSIFPSGYTSISGISGFPYLIPNT